MRVHGERYDDCLKSSVEFMWVNRKLFFGDSLFGSTRIMWFLFPIYCSISLLSCWSIYEFKFCFPFFKIWFDGLVGTTVGYSTTGGCWTTSSRRKMHFRCLSTITCSSYSPIIITAINAPSFSTSSSST